MQKHRLNSWRLLLAGLVIVISCKASALDNSIDPMGINQSLGLIPIANTINQASANQLPPQLQSQTGVPDIQTQAPQQDDYNKNKQSDTFGANLFTGAFARQCATRFNPDYLISVGDKIRVRFWGAFGFESALVVDPQGNVFIPHAGPVQVLGIKNQDLQQLIDASIRKVFKSNVFSYASLSEAQPVRVYVGGFVNRPGLFNGTSMDSLLHFLDQAGGIDPDRGSFLDVQVKRGGKLRASVSLYEFLLNGNMPLIQLSDGDVIFIPPRQQTVKVAGLAENAQRFEFKNAQALTVVELITQAKPLAKATHVRVMRNSGTFANSEYYPLTQVSSVNLNNGDDLEFTADKLPGTITVRVEGEHTSPQEYVLPYGTPLGQLMKDIQLRPDAEAESLQLFRQSVKQRQKEMLATSLRSLEAALLTARSGSSDEARLRKDEADLTLQWVERAKKIEPLGQVQIAQAADRNQLLLENGDVLRIPRKDGLVLISGEVLFPNAVAFDKKLGLSDYINRAGGYTQSADNSRVVVARRDGSFEQTNPSRYMLRVNVRAGDQVMVLPKVDEKDRQFWKDMSQVIFQIAVSAKVVFGL
jgi:protein involved in polysaccharide export with SLBB domain